MKSCRKCLKEKAPSEYYPKRAVCKECLKLRARNYRLSDLSQYKAVKQKYYEANKDSIKQKTAKYRRENLDKHSEYTKKWYKNNKYRVMRTIKKSRSTPEGRIKMLAQTHWQRVKKRNPLAERSSFTFLEWQQVLDRYSNSCAICRASFCSKEATIDHIRSINSGGNNSINNIQPLCQSCNSKKRFSPLKSII